MQRRHSILVAATTITMSCVAGAHPESGDVAARSRIKREVPGEARWHD